ncbi:MAG: hypothetical protein AUI14_09125 [Actinobacteria bacterium 13_2_20CM_2_71_6]|nr:MAG: hypothetical protein AUI14_09125 [Actinobacteria bacterium 13_2_20CM_2_71_6]
MPRQRGRPLRRRAPLLLAAAVTTGWAAIVSYVPVVALAGLLTGALSFRFGTAAWLLAHGVPMRIGGDRFALVPLGLSALAAWRVARAGVHTARAIGARAPGRAALAAMTVALIYGALGGLAAVLVRGQVEPLRAGLTLGGFALAFAGLGAAAESRVLRRIARRLPMVARDALRTGAVAALLVLGAGAAVTGVAVAVSGGQASATLATYHTGVTGQAGLTLLCLVYAPNLATWTAAYLVGPGFAVGVGTTVSAAKVSLGALPAVPVLAGLPDSAVSGLGPLLLGLPMAGGMAAGWLLVRRRLRLAEAKEAPVPGWPALLASGALAGPVAGGLLGLVGWASGGPIGSGRLAVTGPVGWEVASVGAVVVALGVLIASAATRVLIGTRRG